MSAEIIAPRDMRPITGQVPAVIVSVFLIYRFAVAEQSYGLLPPAAALNLAALLPCNRAELFGSRLPHSKEKRQPLATGPVYRRPTRVPHSHSNRTNVGAGPIHEGLRAVVEPRSEK